MGKKRDYSVVLPLTLEELQKFVGRLRKGRNGCWLWKSDGYGGGYGRITLRGQVWMAHGISHVLFKGPIKPGQVIDHLCRVPRCCNPEHLEAVSNSLNTLRGRIPRGNRHYLRKRTHCKHGHPLEGSNLAWQVYKGYKKRVCVECRRRHVRESKERARERARAKARAAAASINKSVVKW